MVFLVPVLATVSLISAIWIQVGDRLNDTLAMSACFAPMLLYILLPRKKMASLWEPTAGLVVAVCFIVFFMAGLIQYWLNGREIGFMVIGPVSSDVVRDTLIGCALITCMLVAGDRVGRIHRSTSSMIKVSLPAKSTLGLAALSQVLWGLACLGCYEVARSFGGIAAATSQLALHDRNVGIANAGTLGMSLWGIFALPAVTTLFIVSLDTNRTKKFRVLALIQAIIVLGFGISMFGSRLLLVLSLVTLVFSYFKMRGKQPPLKAISLVLALLMLISAAVLGGRAQALNTTHETNFLDSVGYSIFDVSIAAAGSLDQLRPKLGSLERGLTALSAALPGSSGRAAEISAARIDVLVVQAIGTTAQAKNSGLPPSLPTSFYLGFPLPFAMLMAFLLGILTGGLTKWLSGLKSPLSTILFGLWGSFLFNVFKGGDLALDAGSEVRRWAYIIILYIVMLILTREKERSNFGHEKNSLRGSRIPDKNPNFRGERSACS